MYTRNWRPPCVCAHLDGCACLTATANERERARARVCVCVLGRSLCCVARSVLLYHLVWRPTVCQCRAQPANECWVCMCVRVCVYTRADTRATTTRARWNRRCLAGHEPHTSVRHAQFTQSHEKRSVRAKQKKRRSGICVSECANCRHSFTQHNIESPHHPTAVEFGGKLRRRENFLCVVSVVRAIESGLHNMRAVCVYEYSHQRGLDRERVYTRQYKHEHILVLLQSNM